jgi:diadenosine tetraphosphate (Ap4A) HIT family hydrolase
LREQGWNLPPQQIAAFFWLKRWAEKAATIKFKGMHGTNLKGYLGRRRGPARRPRSHLHAVAFVLPWIIFFF